MGTLVDTFPGSTLNATLWGDAGIDGTVTVGSNTVTIALPIEGGSSGYFTWIVSNSTYDLTGSCAVVQLVNTATTVTNFYVDFFLNYNYGSTGNAYNLSWEIDDGASATINANYVDNYSQTGVYSATYSSVTHAWLMIDNFTPGTIRWSSSVNGVNWTSRGTVATSVFSAYIPSITALTVQLQSSTDTSLGTASHSVWANFNNPPKLPGPRMNRQQAVKRSAFY
jgi:hypothetical protein